MGLPLLSPPGTFRLTPWETITTGDIIISSMKEDLRQQVIEVATTALAGQPQGIATGVLLKDYVRNNIPGTASLAAIHEVLLKYAHGPDAVIYQPGRGFFRHTKFKDAQDLTPGVIPPKSAGDKIPEEDFYQPFADYLVINLEECTKAICVGGNRLKDKWGTPDVIGIRRPADSDVIPAPVEVVSAEIKVSTDGLITAFGQACSYKSFSHRSYIVVPKTASTDDIARLESLCIVVGIGLILLDPTSSQKPAFEIRTRAARHEPDTFYVNEKLKLIKKELDFPTRALAVSQLT